MDDKVPDADAELEAIANAALSFDFAGTTYRVSSLTLKRDAELKRVIRKALLTMALEEVKEREAEGAPQEAIDFIWKELRENRQRPKDSIAAHSDDVIGHAMATAYLRGEQPHITAQEVQAILDDEEAGGDLFDAIRALAAVEEQAKN